MKKFASKIDAIKAASELGYTEHLGTGECGDYGYGSREYYKAPNAPLNEFGFPLHLATLSYVSGSWALDAY